MSDTEFRDHTTEYLLHASTRVHNVLDKLLKTNKNKDKLNKLLEIERELTSREGQ